MEILKYLLLFLIIFLSNIIQGITGFAGTILAMPFSIMLIDVTLSKFILNVLGILASIYMIIKYYDKIDFKEFKKIVLIMGIGLFIGIVLFNFISLDIILKILPIFIIAIALKGLFFKESKNEIPKIIEIIILLSAGIIHGMFIVGGPLLIIYATRKFDNKETFRATLSLIWLVLNTIIFFSQLNTVVFDIQLYVLLSISVVGLALGIVVGDKLVQKMSQKLFMKLTFILLLISGFSILLK